MENLLALLLFLSSYQSNDYFYVQAVSLASLVQFIYLIISRLFSTYNKNIGHSNRYAPQFLSFQRLFNLLFLPFQVVLFLIKIIALFAKFFHTLQLRPHSLPTIRLYLFKIPTIWQSIFEMLCNKSYF